MAITTAKGFVDKNGNKVQMEPAPHEHTIAEVDGLQTALNGKAALSHEHAIGDVAGLSGEFDKVISKERLDVTATPKQISDNRWLASFSLSYTALYPGLVVSFYRKAVNENSSDELVAKDVVLKNGPACTYLEVELTGGAVDGYLLYSPYRKEIDSEPTANSKNLITSGAVAAALAGKMASKTIDSAPADNADHLISSKGVYDALNQVLSFTAEYTDSSTTTLSNFSTNETFGRIGVFIGSVRITRPRGNGMNPAIAEVPVVVHVFSSTNVQVYYNNALFAHLSGTTWTIDYDGGLLIPLYYGEPAPAVDNTKYITVPPVGATTQNVNAYFWFDHGDYSVWKQTSGPTLVVNSTTPTTSDSAVSVNTSEFFNDEDGDLYWKSEIPDDYDSIPNKGTTSYSILDVHLS